MMQVLKMPFLFPAAGIGARQGQQTIHKQRQAIRFLEHASNDFAVCALVAPSTKTDFTNTANGC